MQLGLERKGTFQSLLMSAVITQQITRGPEIIDTALLFFECKKVLMKLEPCIILKLFLNFRNSEPE